MKYPSQLIENAVLAFKKLPGIGEKTALRLVLHVLKQDVQQVELFGEAIVSLRKEIKHCARCKSLSDHDLCNICSNVHRDHQTICVVENVRDVMAIENTGTYKGLYHVLGGVISPIDGVGPEDLFIEHLIHRVSEQNTTEVIMALSPTIEGDTTIFYISKQLQSTPVKVTTIARGVSFGGELEYTDELTLSRSIATRMPYENYLIKEK